MPITVLSPFSGRPVKVREQDAGRAVKDEEGRLFYVLPKSDGSGYYGAATRAGNPKEEERALELEAKVAVGAGKAKDQVEISLKPINVKPSNSGAIVKLVIVLIILGGLAWLFFYGPAKEYNPWANQSPSRTPPAPAAPATP
jgi:hypothetical protein